jgi:LytS/YehU family sensor histidine kinase
MIKQEKEKINREKQLWEMESRVLRMQMNPHFIFESTNFLHELLLRKARQTAIHYLITFSKLLRLLLQNGEKPFISLHTEIETCRCYAELEEMRMNNKLKSKFYVGTSIDQHSIKIPALSIQPFIEKAIYYRIYPAGEGLLSVSVTQKDDKVICNINDQGVHRRAYLKEPNEERQSVKEINLTQRKAITDSKWFKENVSVEVMDQMNENGNFGGTTVQLTFKAHNDDQDGIN